VVATATITTTRNSASSPVSSWLRHGTSSQAMAMGPAIAAIASHPLGLTPNGRFPRNHQTPAARLSSALPLSQSGAMNPLCHRTVRWGSKFCASFTVTLK
jgi:hypothetical protein